MTPLSLQSGERYCLFRIGAAWFALPALKVREVSFRPKIVPIAGSAAILAGLCHFRNEFLAVLSLRPLLPEGATLSSAEGEILVVNGDHGPWAMLVDEVVSLDALEATTASDPVDDDGWSDVIVGWATYRDHSVRILEPETIYHLAFDVLQRSWNRDGAGASQIDGVPASDAIGNTETAEAAAAAV